MISACCFLAGLSLRGQGIGTLYGTHQIGQFGPFYFASYDLASGVATDMYPLPWFSSPQSSTIDVIGGRYFLCAGGPPGWVMTFDVTGQDPPVTIPLNMSWTSQLYHTAYDPCSGTLMGIRWDQPDSAFFVRIDPAVGITEEHFIGGTWSFLVGLSGAFNPINDIYTVRYHTGLLQIDAVTGNVLTDVPLVLPPGTLPTTEEILDCATGHLVGIGGDTCSDGTIGRMIRTLDSSTGVMTTIGEDCTHDVGYIGGACINWDDGRLYWPSYEGRVHGFDLVTGAHNYEMTVTALRMHLLEHYSQCSDCATAIPWLHDDVIDHVRWIPTDGAIIFEAQETGLAVLLLDCAGRRVQEGRSDPGRNTITCAGLMPGFYFLLVGNTSAQRFFVGR